MPRTILYEVEKNHNKPSDLFDNGPTYQNLKNKNKMNNTFF